MDDKNISFNIRKLFNIAKKEGLVAYCNAYYWRADPQQKIIARGS
jgi:hypothetical protein